MIHADKSWQTNLGLPVKVNLIIVHTHMHWKRVPAAPAHCIITRILVAISVLDKNTIQWCEELHIHEICYSSTINWIGSCGLNQVRLTNICLIQPFKSISPFTCEHIYQWKRKHHPKYCGFEVCTVYTWTYTYSTVQYTPRTRQTSVITT